MVRRKQPTTLPAIVVTSTSRGKSSGFDSNAGFNPRLSEIWIRISAFLSLRAPNTKITYSGIISEWCRFLGAPPGSPESAELIVFATEMHSTSYRAWLEQRPGEEPRMMKGNKIKMTEAELKLQTKKRALEKSSARFRMKNKKEGLEHTLSNATISKKFAALRRIYRMLISANLVTRNPFDSDLVPAPAKESGRKRPTEMIDFKLVKKVIGLPDTSTPKGLRDQAILAVLFGGGLRRSEAARVRLGDVRYSAGKTLYLYLRSTKAKKDAEQALPLWAAKIVQNLVDDRRESGASDSDFLFVSYSGQAGNTVTNKPISDSGIYNLFTLYCRLAGAGKFITPHSARATAITKLLADGIPHRKVQEFSRHASIQMVEAYDKRRIGVDENPGKDLDFD